MRFSRIACVRRRRSIAPKSAARPYPISSYARRKLPKRFRYVDGDAVSGAFWTTRNDNLPVSARSDRRLSQQFLIRPVDRPPAKDSLCFIVQSLLEVRPKTWHPAYLGCVRTL